MPDAVLDPLRDDLNTHGALAACHALARAGEAGALAAALRLLGLQGDAVPVWISGRALAPEVGARIEALLAARAEAKALRDFATADAIRDRLLAAGVEVRDRADGADWALAESFDAAKLDTAEQR